MQHEQGTRAHGPGLVGAAVAKQQELALLTHPEQLGMLPTALEEHAHPVAGVQLVQPVHGSRVVAADLVFRVHQFGRHGVQVVHVQRSAEGGRRVPAVQHLVFQFLQGAHLRRHSGQAALQPLGQEQVQALHGPAVQARVLCRLGAQLVDGGHGQLQQVQPFRIVRVRGHLGREHGLVDEAPQRVLVVVQQRAVAQRQAHGRAVQARDDHRHVLRHARVGHHGLEQPADQFDGLAVGALRGAACDVDPALIQGAACHRMARSLRRAGIVSGLLRVQRRRHGLAHAVQVGRVGGLGRTRTAARTRRQDQRAVGRRLHAHAFQA